MRPRAGSGQVLKDLLTMEKCWDFILGDTQQMLKEMRGMSV
jgi:hypothetical protein